MLTWSRRTATGVTIAALIIALATMGGYRLHSSAGPALGHVRLALGSFYQT